MYKSLGFCHVLRDFADNFTINPGVTTIPFGHLCIF